MFCSKCGKENADEANFCKDCGAALQTQGSPAAIPLANTPKAASLTRRFFNYFIDSQFANIFFAGVVLFFGFKFFNEEIGIGLAVIAFFFYPLIFEWAFQRTLGKVITGTKVVTTTGEKPTFLPLLGRTLARYIPFEPFSYLFYGSHPTKGWHDRLSHTLVVNSNMTKEQVQQIRHDQNESGGGIWIAIVLGGFFSVCIIGILVAVVLASLNDARDAGIDAGTKQTMLNLRAQAEIYYAANDDSYLGLCSDTRIQSLFDSLSTESSSPSCTDSADAYAVSIALQEGNYYCVDSDRFADELRYPVTNKTRCQNFATTDSFSTGTKPKNFAELEKQVADSMDLPTMVDEETRLDSMYFDDNYTLNYNYTLVNYTARELEWTSLKEFIAPKIEDSFCTDPTMEYFRKENIPLQWNYYGSARVKIGSLSLSTKDCY